jgi:hypothetical protein
VFDINRETAAELDLSCKDTVLEERDALLRLLEVLVEVNRGQACTVCVGV